MTPPAKRLLPPDSSSLAASSMSDARALVPRGERRAQRGVAFADYDHIHVMGWHF